MRTSIQSSKAAQELPFGLPFGLPFALTWINTQDDPRIALYRSLRDTEALQAAHGRAQVFIAEGKTAVTRLLQSSFEVVSVFALPKHYAALQPLIAGRGLPSECLLSADEDVMNAIVGFKLHVGLMAMVRVPPMLNLDTCSQSDVQSLFPRAAPILALNTLADAENVGAIVRTCAAFGVRTLLVDEGTCSPYIRRAVRVSMGGIFSVQVARCGALQAACERLRSEAGCTIVAAELSDRAIPLPAYQFPARSVIVLGSEGAGVADAVLHTSDAVVAIPMSPVFNKELPSLNVGAAAAIVLYEAMRGGLPQTF
jgi:tRNA G18 (ribose-2'-O)-methylase SpoU